MLSYQKKIVKVPTTAYNLKEKKKKIVFYSTNPIIHFSQQYLTTLKEKNCILLNSVQEGCLAASDLFRMRTQSIKFYTFHYHEQMLEKCDSSNRQYK